MRGLLRHLLSFTANHQRPTYTADAMGGQTAVYATVNSKIKCALIPVASELSESYARRSIVVTHQIVTDVDCEATDGDRFVIGTAYYVLKGLSPFACDYVGFPVFVYDVEQRLT